MALPYVGASEGRIRAAIELVESWCRGDVALEHVRAAYAAFNDEYYVYAIYSAVFAVHDYEAITYASASAAAAAYAPYGSAFRRAACDAIRRVVHCPKLQEQP
jgi:hypothetical protein